jgi:hypothetical protein
MLLSIINNIEILFHPLDQFEIFVLYIYWPSVGMPIGILETLETIASLGIREILKTIWTMFMFIVIKFLLDLYFFVLSIITDGLQLTNSDGKFNLYTCAFYFIILQICTIRVLDCLEKWIIRLQEFYRKWKNSK